MNPWFRLYVDTPAERKLLRIARITGHHKVFVIGFWTTILCFAAQSNVPARLLLSDDIPMTVDDIADEMGLETDVVQGLIDQMIALNMLVIEGDVICIAHWDERQFVTSDDTDDWNDLVERFGLSHHEALVWQTVQAFCRRRDGVCYATQNTIAQRVGLSVKTVHRALRRLVELGLIIDHTPDLRNAPHRLEAVIPSLDKMSDEVCPTVVLPLSDRVRPCPTVSDQCPTDVQPTPENTYKSIDFTQPRQNDSLDKMSDEVCPTYTDTETDTDTDIYIHACMRKSDKNAQILDPVEHMLQVRAQGTRTAVADPSQDNGTWLQTRADAERVYREVTGRFPRPAIRDCIRTLAGENGFDLARWERVIRTWVERGYNPSNVDGMARWYREGIPEARAGPQAQAKQRNVLKREISFLTLEQVNRIRARNGHPPMTQEELDAEYCRQFDLTKDELYALYRERGIITDQKRET